MERIELTDSTTRAEVVPERGAIVTRFDVDGAPILYLDRATLEDPTKNVRGGVPFLFPTAGRLNDDRYQGREMRQHGFARNLPFTIDRCDERSVVLSLAASDATRASFPFEFRIELTISVSGRALQIAQRYQNLGTAPMPLHAGFHPYFFVPDAEKTRLAIETHATRAFDNTRKHDVAFTGFDFTKPEVDLHLVDHGGSSSRLRRPGAPTVEISGSAEFGHWVVWAIAGKDFVCVEPWTAPRNALNSGEGLLWIASGDERRLMLTIRAA